jgi:hypothetical protein
VYYREEYAQALQLILDAMDKTPNLNRELLDTGIRAALQCKNTERAVDLARLSKDYVSGMSAIVRSLQWKGQSAGLACIASDAFHAAELDEGEFRKPTKIHGQKLLSLCSPHVPHLPFTSL